MADAPTEIHPVAIFGDNGNNNLYDTDIWNKVWGHDGDDIIIAVAEEAPEDAYNYT